MNFLQPASSFQQFFLLPLSDVDLSIWTNPNQLTMNAQYRSDQMIHVYFWDLHALAQQVGETETSGNSGRITSDVGYYTIPSDDPNWSQIWLADYQDDTGSGSIDRVPTVFTVAIANRYVPLQFTCKGSFSLAPLIPYNENTTTPGVSETVDGETAVWNSVLFPGYPFMIGSTIPNQLHYGPVFIESAKFEISGEGNLNAVSVHISFTGGRVMRAPTFTALPLELKLLPSGIDSLNPQIVAMVGQDNADAWLAPLSAPQPYRVATIMDCMALQGSYTTVADLNTAGDVFRLFESDDPQERIVGISLEMHQKIDFRAPSPASPFTIEQGPRFASITERVVTGKITYQARTDLMDPPTTDSLTLYFGTVFLFPMDNIEWLPRETSAKAGSFHLHTFTFKARAADNAITIPYAPGAEGMPCSEFAIPLVSN